MSFLGFDCDRELPNEGRNTVFPILFPGGVGAFQKRTMEIADALYGVSMRADGISAVVGQRVTARDSGGFRLIGDVVGRRPVSA